MKKIIVLLITVFCLCLPFTAFATEFTDKNYETACKNMGTDLETHPYCYVRETLEGSVVYEFTKSPLTCTYDEKKDTYTIEWTGLEVDKFIMSQQQFSNGRWGGGTSCRYKQVFYHKEDLEKYLVWTNYTIYYTGTDKVFMTGSSISTGTEQTPAPVQPSFQPSTPLPALTEGTGAEVVRMGTAKIMEVIKMIVLAVFGVLCLILLSPLVKRFLVYLKQFIMRL